MAVAELDPETHIIANTILILALSHFFLAVILTATIKDSFLTAFIAIPTGFALAFIYYLRSTIENDKIKKERAKESESDVDGT